MTNGFREVQEALEKVPHAVEKVVVGATRAGATVIAKEAKRLAPVESGTLKLSIGVAKAKKKDTPDGVVRFYIVPKTRFKKSIKAKVNGDSVKIKTKVSSYYAHFLEFGTSKMSPKPFLRPAVEHTKREVVDAFKTYVFKRVDNELEKLK